MLQDLEKIIMSHPAVEDCTVTGFRVEGIGELPRAYIVQKHGYETTSEEILAYVDYRTPHTEKLRAGVVFVDHLAKDPSGKLYISLDRFNKDAEGMDYGFIRKQPKVFSTVNC
jgi:acyl-coenzyme A synthetase/AMP-(fatty) acid ligase